MFERFTDALAEGQGHGYPALQCLILKGVSNYAPVVELPGRTRVPTRMVKRAAQMPVMNPCRPKGFLRADHAIAVPAPTTIEANVALGLVLFQYMPKSMGQRLVEAITAHANAVSTSIKPGGLRAIRIETHPTIALAFLASESSRSGVRSRPRAPWRMSLTSEVDVIIKTPANVDMPAAMTPDKKTAPPRGVSMDLVSDGIARSGLASSG
jgi:hypothetical protein